MGVILGLEWCLEDRIRVTVVGDRNVLIVAARVNGEEAGVVCVQFSSVIDGYMQFNGMWVGDLRGIKWGDGRYGGHLDICALAHSRV